MKGGFLTYYLHQGEGTKFTEQVKPGDLFKVKDVKFSLDFCRNNKHSKDSC